MSEWPVLATVGVDFAYQGNHGAQCSVTVSRSLGMSLCKRISRQSLSGNGIVLMSMSDGIRADAFGSGALPAIG